MTLSRRSFFARAAAVVGGVVAGLVGVRAARPAEPVAQGVRLIPVGGGCSVFPKAGEAPTLTVEYDTGTLPRYVRHRMTFVGSECVERVAEGWWPDEGWKPMPDDGTWAVL